MKSVAVILGSAYLKAENKNETLEEIEVDTRWGTHTVYKVKAIDRPAYLLFRHGNPHQLLPNQINYRAQAAALQAVGCGALLITSSVGVMDAKLPLYQPMLVDDLMMPENRLPDGGTCTMFPEPAERHGHLVLSEGLFSKALSRQVEDMASEDPDWQQPDRDVIFAYAGGPRGKTSAENRMWRQLGANVNSMTLAPEIVLANELEIPSTAVVVGHKYSVPDLENPQTETDVTSSLEASKDAMEKLIQRFLEKAQPVEFANHIYRFE